MVKTKKNFKLAVRKRNLDPTVYVKSNQGGKQNGQNIKKFRKGNPPHILQ